MLRLNRDGRLKVLLGSGRVWWWREWRREPIFGAPACDICLTDLCSGASISGSCDVT